MRKVLPEENVIQRAVESSHEDGQTDADGNYSAGKMLAPGIIQTPFMVEYEHYNFDTDWPQLKIWVGRWRGEDWYPYEDRIDGYTGTQVLTSPESTMVSLYSGDYTVENPPEKLYVFYYKAPGRSSVYLYADPDNPWHPYGIRDHAVLLAIMTHQRDCYYAVDQIQHGPVYFPRLSPVQAETDKDAETISAHIQSMPYAGPHTGYDWEPRAQSQELSLTWDWPASGSTYVQIFRWWSISPTASTRNCLDVVWYGGGTASDTTTSDREISTVEPYRAELLGRLHLYDDGSWLWQWTQPRTDDMLSQRIAPPRLEWQANHKRLHCHAGKGFDTNDILSETSSSRGCYITIPDDTDANIYIGWADETSIKGELILDTTGYEHTRKIGEIVTDSDGVLQHLEDYLPNLGPWGFMPNHYGGDGVGGMSENVDIEDFNEDIIRLKFCRGLYVGHETNP